MHSKRRMQTIQPQILIHRNPTCRIKRSWRGRPVLILRAKLCRVLIRASLGVRAWMLDYARKHFVGVEDKGRDILVGSEKRGREGSEAIVPVCYCGCFEGLG